MPLFFILISYNQKHYEDDKQETFSVDCFEAGSHYFTSAPLGLSSILLLLF